MDPQPAADARVAEARAHFDLGVSHIDREEWDSALAEFLKSRDLVPAKANTKNAAICLRKVGRFDDSLAMFETVLREFPDLSAGERAAIEHEIADLTSSIGSIEIAGAPAGCSVTIDGLERGQTPLAGPIRIAAGSHVVRVAKEGALPYETRVDLAGRQDIVLQAKLAPLTQAGRLRVTERNGKSVHVVIDGAIVGTTPWEGALPPGMHTVLVRGDGPIGTPPAQVSVDLDRVAALEVVAVDLPSRIRIGAQPAPAEIALDGVPVGRGSWEGRVHPGPHHIGWTLAGHAPFTRDVLLSDGADELVEATLEPLGAHSPVTVELSAGLPIGVLWGGEVVGGCSGTCTSSVPLGGQALLHLTYWFASDFGLGIQAGYVRWYESVSPRSESIAPVGRSLSSGTVDDALRLGGVMVGGEIRYRQGQRWPLTLSLVFGALVGTVTDERRGAFVDSTALSYGAGAAHSANADYLYAGPGIRVARRLGESFELSVGLTVLVMAAVTTPRWSSSVPVAAGSDGEGFFPSASLSGELMIAAVPELGVRYRF